MKLRAAGVVGVSVALVIFGHMGCSGDRTKTLFDYPKGEAVAFTISGTATCNVCTDDQLPVVGMQVEVLPKDDPTTSFGFKSFEGLGAFSLSGLSAEPGRRLEVRGTLFLEGTAEPSSISAYGEVTAPDHDGGSVALVLKFPSNSGGD